MPLVHSCRYFSSSTFLFVSHRISCMNDCSWPPASASPWAQSWSWWPAVGGQGPDMSVSMFRRGRWNDLCGAPAEYVATLALIWLSSQQGRDHKPTGIDIILWRERGLKLVEHGVCMVQEPWPSWQKLVWQPTLTHLVMEGGWVKTVQSSSLLERGQPSEIDREVHDHWTTAFDSTVLYRQQNPFTDGLKSSRLKRGKY